MHASIHLSDVGVSGLRQAGRFRHQGHGPDGPRHSRVLLAAPLPTGPTAPPQPGRVAHVAFWDDDEAIDTFEASHPIAELLDGGWSTRLELRRAVPEVGGHFYGVDDSFPTGGEAGNDEPAAVLTIGHLKLPRLVPFLRASRKAEKQSVHADGLLWSTAFANISQQIVSTLTLWESGAAAHRYALAAGGGHKAAIGKDRHKTFHHVGSFLRFTPYEVRGHLDGRNPLPASVTATLAGSSTT